MEIVELKKSIKPSRYGISKFSSSLSLDDIGNLYFYVGNGIVRISADEKMHVNYFELPGENDGGSRINGLNAPKIFGSNCFHYRTMDNKPFIVKTDLVFNVKWKKKVENNWGYRQILSNDGKLLCSTLSDNGELNIPAQLHKIDEDGNIVWTYSEDTDDVDVSMGCLLSDGNILFPVIRNNIQVIAYKVINNNGELVYTIPTEPEDKNCFECFSPIPILKDVEGNVLIFATNPPNRKRNVPSVECILLSPNGKYRFRQSYSQEMLIFPSCFVSNESVICNSTVATDCGYKNYISIFNIRTQENRKLLDCSHSSLYHKCIFYNGLFFVFTRTDKQRPAKTYVALFNSNLDYISSHFLGDTSIVGDIKIINDIIFILNEEMLSIYKIVY